MESTSRRLPVYLLLDISASMVGEPIEAIRQAIAAMLADLRSDPQAIETAWLSIITFHSEARELVPLTALTSFRAPRLFAGGESSLGAALRLCRQRIDAELAASAGRSRDWSPLVFVMTDGTPTDEWRTDAAKLKERCGERIFACAAGPEADRAMLAELSTRVIDLSRLQPDELTSYFRWVSEEIKDAVQRPAH
jgi:uncharacterized protein YegL